MVIGRKKANKLSRRIDCHVHVKQRFVGAKRRGIASADTNKANTKIVPGNEADRKALDVLLGIRNKVLDGFSVLQEPRRCLGVLAAVDSR